ncbi:MAG: CoA-binding protein [Sphingobacteriia bacterium 28-36-52]|jgi:predicted CoA-binding protein|nr:MAG: CoA-binding protein [Sphingobacteriia bacterium 32-37-4]OYZ02207.1 MAG: CoA-binding protein [Sphingobacteriia bacterium 28-36-52]
MKKTLVLGASENPARYSFEAVTRLRKHGHEVVAVGRKSAVVAGVQIETETPVVNDIDTVTLYLNPTAQKAYYDFILSLHPKRIIFNPGTENEELEELAQQNGIAAIEACTLVMLNTGQY